MQHKKENIDDISFQTEPKCRPLNVGAGGHVEYTDVDGSCLSEHRSRDCCFLETLATISCSHGYRVCNNHHLSVCLGWLTKVQGLDF